jgi:hypothetical protein
MGKLMGLVMPMVGNFNPNSTVDGLPILKPVRFRLAPESSVYDSGSIIEKLINRLADT